MTLLDDRQRQVPGHSNYALAGVTELVERMLAELAPEPAQLIATGLFGDVARIYCGVLEGRELLPAHRIRIRVAGQRFAASGGLPDTVIDMLGRLASHLIGGVALRRLDQVGSLVDAAHLLVRDFLSGAAEPTASTELTKEYRWTMVQRLLLDRDVPPEFVCTLDTDYVVAVLRFGRQVSTDCLMALLEEYGVNGVLSTPAEDGAIILVPERAMGLLSRLRDECQSKLGLAPWLVTAPCLRAEIASGYQEAKDILALALLAGYRPGRYQLDDFLVEYAIVNDPMVSDRLMTVIEPLCANEALRETLEALIRTDFNRGAAARELFIHRSTLDYRIRRIEEITRQGPLSGRGAHVLRVAMTARAMAVAVAVEA